MKVQVAKSWDFNQMLVASVFSHLLLMVFVIFLPKSTYEEIVITPAFVVELIDIPTNHKKSVQKTARKKLNPKSKPKSVPPPKQMKPIQQTLKLPPKPKADAVPPDKSKKVLNKLNQLDKKPQGIIQELEQLAKLVPKVAVKNPVVKTSQPIQEKTFDELNVLKNKKVEFKPSNIEPLPIEDPLDEFENLKMKEELEVAASAPKGEPEKKIDTLLQELKFASLSPNTVEMEKKQDEKSAVDLFQELEEMASLPSVDNESSETQKQEPTPAQEKSQAYDSIIQKLESLKNERKEFKTDIVVTRSLSKPKPFESNIRKVSAPQQVHVEVVVSPSTAFVQSPNEGEPSADILAQYVGVIHEKVYKNWREPLAQKHNKEVIYSFYIYPKGNIDRPELKMGSKVKLLDSLALRAILTSEPFPPFPIEIKSSNLNISIHFKYISDNKT